MEEGQRQSDNNMYNESGSEGPTDLCLEGEESSLSGAPPMHYQFRNNLDESVCDARSGSRFSNHASS